MYAEVVLDVYDAYLAEKKSGESLRQTSSNSPSPSPSSRPSSADDKSGACRPKKIRVDSNQSLRSPATPGAAGSPNASRRRAERAFP